MVLERRDPLVISRPYYLETFECGYCHCKKTGVPEAARAYPAEAKMPRSPTHVTIGCKVEQMSCRDYDEFINLGFRRLGDFLYKGDMLRGCCRMYTIRTQLLEMAVSKEHRQVVNRFKRAVADPKEPMAQKACTDRASNRLFSLSSLIEAEQQSSRFYTRFEPARFSEEKFALYKRYQTVVHNDKPAEVSKSQFTNFLCDSPFLDHERDGSNKEWQQLNAWVEKWRPGQTDGPSKSRLVARLGPTHECYYLDGRLIAISVLDFLPSGVSSVYLIWDPDYAHLSLGTLLAIREVQMCHELNLGYYYLGYYMEDCDKMRYKKKFGGELLDVCNETYVPLEKVRSMMEKDKFWVISENGHEEDESGDDESGDEESGDEESGDEESGDEESGDEQSGDEENSKDSRDLREVGMSTGDSGRNQDTLNDDDRASCGVQCGKICCDEFQPKKEASAEIGEAEGEAEEGEHDLTLSGRPGSWKHNIVNVSQQIYGDKETYRVANMAAKVLRSELGYSAPELPPVLPGAIPLCQLVAWIQQNALDLELPVTVYGARTGRMHECDLGKVPPMEKSHVIDFLRLFGLERTQTAIIIA